MNHVSYLRVSVLFNGFLTKVLETIKSIFSGNFCTLMYLNKWIEKKLKSCIFFTTRTSNSNTMCGQASTLEANDSSYCRESRELLVKEHLINLLLNIHVVEALNNRIPWFYQFHLPWGQTQVVDSKTWDEGIFYFLSFPMIRLCTGYPVHNYQTSAGSLFARPRWKNRINKSIKTRKAPGYS